MRAVGSQTAECARHDDEHRRRGADEADGTEQQKKGRKGHAHGKHLARSDPHRRRLARAKPPRHEQQQDHRAAGKNRRRHDAPADGDGFAARRAAQTRHDRRIAGLLGAQKGGEVLAFQILIVPLARREQPAPVVRPNRRADERGQRRAIGVADDRLARAARASSTSRRRARPREWWEPRYRAVERATRLPARAGGRRRCAPRTRCSR